jgi:hypothetical protein
MSTLKAAVLALVAAWAFVTVVLWWFLRGPPVDMSLVRAGQWAVVLVGTLGVYQWTAAELDSGR